MVGTPAKTVILCLSNESKTAPASKRGNKIDVAPLYSAAFIKTVIAKM